MSSTKWVPDEQAHNCFGCKTKFSMLTRRHHCRHCGGVFCNGCSEKRVTLKHSEGPVRVCNPCHTKLSTKQKAASIVSLGKQTTRLLYETRSVCIHCAITEQKGFKFSHVIAYVLQNAQKIYLYSLCPNHPHVPSITLICSNATFYHHLMTYKMSFEYGYSIYDQFLGIAPITTQQLATLRPYQLLYPNSKCISTTTTVTPQLTDQTRQQPNPAQPTTTSPTPNGPQNAPDASKSTQEEDPYTALSSLHTVPVQIISDNEKTLEQYKSAQIYGLDSKELYKRLLLPQKTPHLMPFIVELELAMHDGILRSDSDIISELYEIFDYYPQGTGFLLKINVGLAGSFADDGASVLAEVNAKLLQIQEWLDRYFLEQEQLFLDQNVDQDDTPAQKPSFFPSHPSATASTTSSTSTSSSTSSTRQNRITILVDTSFDRLILLCEAANSIFLKSNVFPYLRYYLLPGEEATCITEISEAFSKLSTFSHMNVCLAIILESEGGLLLPNLRQLMQLLLQNTYLVRMILFNQQRNVTTVVNRISDRYELVHELYQKATMNLDDLGFIQHSLAMQSSYSPMLASPRSASGEQVYDQQTIQHHQQQLYQDQQAAIVALQELKIDPQMVQMISRQIAAQDNLHLELTQQQQQSLTGAQNQTVTTADGVTVSIPPNPLTTLNPAFLTPQQQAQLHLPQPQQIRLEPQLLSELTYKWLESPLYYYPRRADGQQGPNPAPNAQQPPSSPGSPQAPIKSDTCMETVDIMPLLNAINAATDNNTPIQTWFPLSAFAPLSGLISKRLRTSSLFNLNIDPLSCICSVIIHKNGYDLPTTTGQMGSSGLTAVNAHDVTSLKPNKMVDILNMGQIFDLKKLMNQIEQFGDQQSAPSSTSSGPNKDAADGDDKKKSAQDAAGSSNKVEKQQKSWKALLSDALKLTEIISNSTLPSSSVSASQLVSFTGDSKSNKRKVKSTQLVCILNDSDIGCIDVLRRCRALSVTKNNTGMTMFGNNGSMGGPGMGKKVQFVSSDHQCL